MFKKLFTACLLIVLFALPLTAWGQDSPVSAPGEFPIVEEPITLDVLMLGHAIVEDFATNTFTQWYSERTGININFNLAPPNQGQEVLNIRIASGDLPGFSGFPRRRSRIIPHPNSRQNQRCNGNNGQPSPIAHGVSSASDADDTNTGAAG